MTTPKNPKIVEALDVLLADHQLLYQKLRGFHWNVRGPRFFALHAKFEELYDATAEHVDSIAERIAALGARPTSTLKRYLSKSRIAEDENTNNAEDMVRVLVTDMGKLVEWSHELAKLAEDAGDRGTVGLADGLAEFHEEQKWMLSATLES